MNKPTIEQIKNAMNRAGMVFFTAPYSVTLGAIRTKDNTANTFNDWLFAHFYGKDGKSVFAIVPGTTDAGLYYRLNPMNVEGTAIIQHGKQYRGAFQLQDPKKNPEQRGHRGQKAFRQIKPLDYWRDADRDKYLDFEGETQTDIFFTNGHYMGTRGVTVDKWSAGCWGSIEKYMNQLFAVCEGQISAGLGDVFSFALLHENDF